MQVATVAGTAAEAASKKAEYIRARAVKEREEAEHETIALRANIEVTNRYHFPVFESLMSKAHVSRRGWFTSDMYKVSYLGECSYQMIVVLVSPALGHPAACAHLRVEVTPRHIFLFVFVVVLSIKMCEEAAVRVKEQYLTTSDARH